MLAAQARNGVVLLRCALPQDVPPAAVEEMSNGSILEHPVTSDISGDLSSRVRAASVSSKPVPPQTRPRQPSVVYNLRGEGLVATPDVLDSVARSRANSCAESSPLRQRTTARGGEMAAGRVAAAAACGDDGTNDVASNEESSCHPSPLVTTGPVRNLAVSSPHGQGPSESSHLRSANDENEIDQEVDFTAASPTPQDPALKQQQKSVDMRRSPRVSASRRQTLSWTHFDPSCVVDAGGAFALLPESSASASRDVAALQSGAAPRLPSRQAPSPPPASHVRLVTSLSPSSSEIHLIATAPPLISVDAGPGGHPTREVGGGDPSRWHLRVAGSALSRYSSDSSSADEEDRRGTAKGGRRQRLLSGLNMALRNGQGASTAETAGIRSTNAVPSPGRRHAEKEVAGRTASTDAAMSPARLLFDYYYRLYDAWQLSPQNRSRCAAASSEYVTTPVDAERSQVATEGRPTLSPSSSPLRPRQPSADPDSENEVAAGVSASDVSSSCGDSDDGDVELRDGSMLPRYAMRPGTRRWDAATHPAQPLGQAPPTGAQGRGRHRLDDACVPSVASEPALSLPSSELGAAPSVSPRHTDDEGFPPSGGSSDDVAIGLHNRAAVGNALWSGIDSSPTKPRRSIVRDDGYDGEGITRLENAFERLRQTATRQMSVRISR